MARYFFKVEYDGTHYVGWQRQANGKSVQGVIEKAILDATGDVVTLGGAGRTDSGVHGTGQVGHCDLSRLWKTWVLRNALNAHLTMAEEAVSILDIALVPEDYDSRFTAYKRHYLYRIVNRPAPAPLEANRAWWVKKPLDSNAMHEAAQRLVGHHDFTTFRASHCQARSPVKTMEFLDVRRNGEIVEIRASAQSFLHNQIRSFAGTLKLVGAGKWSADDVTAALEARDRKACGPVAPPDGLYFLQVDYAKPVEWTADRRD